MRSQLPRLLGWRIVLALGLLLVSGIAGTAQATSLFIIDSSQSTLSVQSASFFALTPSGIFNTELDPNGISNFTRPLSGTLLADAATGDVESLDLLVLGSPLVADQIMLDSRANSVHLQSLDAFIVFDLCATRGEELWRARSQRFPHTGSQFGSGTV